MLLAALLSVPAWSFHLIEEIHIPGSDGWDYLATDPSGQRLFVSHGTHVEVVDTATRRVVGTVDNTPGVHGIALAEDLNRGYVSAGATALVVVFDLKSLARLAEIKTTGENPDAILYEPKSKRVLTFNGRGQNVTVIDAQKNEVIGTVPLGAKPEFAVSDAEGHVFVNLEDRNSIAQIDPATLKVVSVWGLDHCVEPSGLAIDRPHHRLFSVCSNKIMAVTDATTGRHIAELTIGGNVDGAGFDDARQEAYASGGDGTLTVVKEQSPDKFSVVESVKTKAGARTMVVDSGAHRLYLSAGQRGPTPSPTAADPHPRARVIDGSFEVLVLAP
jgi:hypothetical protein